MNPEKELPHGIYHNIVLAAAPTLTDPNFARSLVYIARHDEEGAFGMVMNRPLGKTLGEAATSPGVIPDELLTLPLYVGGPVHPGNLLLAVFTRGPGKDQVECQIEMNMEQVAAYMGQETVWVRAFVGCSGWGEGQLEQEMEGDFWKACPIDPLLFDERYTGKLWPVYYQGIERWRKLLPYLPEHPEKN